MLMVIALVAKLMPNAYGSCIDESLGFWITIGLNFWLGLLNGL
jgi:hypothetical protein